MSDWLTSNRLTLNVLKSNYVIFRPYQKTLSHPAQIMMYDNEKNCSAELESKQYVEYLGLLIDSSLTWKSHIDQIALKVSKTVGLLAKLRHFIPRITLINIYKSLILPHVSYGLTVWGMASKCYVNKILILQKRALRFINFFHFKEHAVPLFIEADSLPVDFLHYEAVCCRMYDIQNGIAPKNILDLFTHTSSIHTYRTRSTTSNAFYIKQSRLEIQKNAFSRVGAKVWNGIPVSVRNLNKKKLKQALHSILMNILKESDSYLDFQQIFQSIKKYQTF